MASTYLKNDLKNDSFEVDLSAIKLEKLGYIEKRNEVDYDNEEYYAYRITNDGVEILLQKRDTSPFLDANSELNQTGEIARFALNAWGSWEALARWLVPRWKYRRKFVFNENHDIDS